MWTCAFPAAPLNKDDALRMKQEIDALMSDN
jgi:hypothetical protein